LTIKTFLKPFDKLADTAKAFVNRRLLVRLKYRLDLIWRLAKVWSGTKVSGTLGGLAQCWAKVFFYPFPWRDLLGYYFQSFVGKCVPVF
jgi:hypothetical protein